MVHFHLKNEIYEANIADDGKLEKINTAINFRQFYMDLNLLFEKLGFKDMLGYKKDKEIGNFFLNMKQKGEFGDPKANLTRKYNSYETLFLKNTFHNRTEYEIKWHAHRKAEHSPYGWAEFEFDITVRNIKDIEILEGNQKKILQEGTWELRNKFKYKNSIIPKFLNNVPFIKNHETLKELYVNAFHLKLMKADFEFEKNNVYEKNILELIRKHFNTNLLK